MAVKIGMNGFGRIGRYMARLLADEKDLVLTQVNARAGNENLAHLLKYDSTIHCTYINKHLVFLWKLKLYTQYLQLQISSILHIPFQYYHQE